MLGCIGDLKGLGSKWEFLRINYLDSRMVDP